VGATQLGRCSTCHSPNRNAPRRMVLGWLSTSRPRRKYLAGGKCHWRKHGIPRSASESGGRSCRRRWSLKKGALSCSWEGWWEKRGGWSEESDLGIGWFWRTWQRGCIRVKYLKKKKKKWSRHLRVQLHFLRRQKLSSYRMPLFLFF